MKFRNPETGEMFDNIDKAREYYCNNNGITCDHCKFSFDHNMLDIPCAQYCKRLPEEAAYLMGYEVVVDDNSAHTITVEHENCPQCGKNGGMIQNTLTGAIGCMECGWTNKKENNMDKPFDFSPVRTERGIKIGNIELTTNGIEIDGRKIGMDKPLKDWTLGELKDYCHRAPHDCIGCKVKGGRNNCPFDGEPAKWDLDEKPRFTEQEVEDAKTIRRILRDYGKLTRSIYEIPTYGCIYLKKEAFPSIRPGQSYTLDEIIGGAE